MAGTRWTDEETEIARQLLAARAPEDEFRKLLGRSKHMAAGRIHRLAHPTTSVEPYLMAEPRPEVPDGLWDDRDRRASARLSLTARFCGDPPPGYSALDQRERQVRP